MTDLRAWDKAMKAQVKAIEEKIVETQRSAAVAFFDKVMEFSPVYSGYYKANHRVTFTDQVDLSPEKRIARKGAHVGMIETARAAGEAKLSSKKLPVVVRIGNAVPYAVEVEFPGGGVTPMTGNRPVYANARAVAVEQAKGGRG